MQEILKKYNINLEEKQIKKLEKFLKIFMEKNSQINLSAIRESDEIILKHFVDSLILTNFVDLKWKVLDLWTGWWFPWIPLKIFLEEQIKLSLLDSVGKKLDAIDGFLEELELSKDTITVKARAEELAHNKDFRSKFRFVISRATAYLPTLIEYSMAFVRVDWYLIAYKLEDEAEIEESKKALKANWAEIERIEKYEIDGQKRVLIFIKKIWKTPSKYPRKIWEPRKNPII